MKITGIICEYNPLHNGHLYQIQQVRKNGAEAIVAVMSGNFMQRGDVAVMDKFTRAKLAVESGVDLVIELPVPYAVAPAEVFALGGVALLSALPNVTEISFGSECGDLELLRQAAKLIFRRFPLRIPVWVGFGSSRKATEFSIGKSSEYAEKSG